MLAFLLLSRENRWSSKSHHACMFGRVVTEVNAVKIRPMGQIFRQLFRYQPSKSPAADLFSSEARCSSYDSRGKIPVSCSVVTNLPTWWWSSSCSQCRGYSSGGNGDSTRPCPASATPAPEWQHSDTDTYKWSSVSCCKVSNIFPFIGSLWTKNTSD